MAVLIEFSPPIFYKFVWPVYLIASYLRTNKLCNIKKQCNLNLKFDFLKFEQLLD